MNINAAFKPFDIRGLNNIEVDNRFAFLLGKALGLQSHPNKVLVACDSRPLSPILKQNLINGLSLTSSKIYDLEVVPVPQFYYGAISGDFDLGIMVTASHISDKESGFKLIASSGLPFDQKQIQDLKLIMQKIKNDPIIVPLFTPVRLNNSQGYIDSLIKALPKSDFKSKIVLDYTNSSVGDVVNSLFSRLHIHFTTINSNNSGNPLLEENRKELSKTVISSGSDLGIIWDSDGDRVAFVDHNGKMIPMSFIIGMLGSTEITHSIPKVITDVRAGLVVKELVTEAGGILEVTPSWAQYFKFAMKKDPQIAFGGETSGHFIFKEYFSIDDGIFAALKFMIIWENQEAKAKLESLYKKYFELPETNFPCPKDKSVQILEKASEYYRKKGYDISIIDGLSVFGPEFKFNLRSSLTENYLRLNLETHSEHVAQNIIAEIERIIE